MYPREIHVYIGENIVYHSEMLSYTSEIDIYRRERVFYFSENVIEILLKDIYQLNFTFAV